MSSKPSDFIVLSKEMLTASLSVPDGSDTVWRCIVSRSYYGAFLAVRAYLTRRGLPLGGDVHKQARERILGLAPKFPLDALDESPEEMISGLLGILVRRRRIADYEEGQIVTRDTAEKSVIAAAEVIRLVEQLSGL